MMSAWRGRSSTRTVIAEGSTPLALASRRTFSAGDASSSTTPFCVAGADRDLLHVDVGRMQQRAAIGHRHGRDRARHGLGAQRGALERIDGDIDLAGRRSCPTFSPMNSIGASSRSPSPITTVPSIGSLLSSRRIASTAAWSAAFSLPWPRSRAADTAARSVTRTISSVRMRSSKSCCGTEIWVDIGVLLKFSRAVGRRPATHPLTRDGSEPTLDHDPIRLNRIMISSLCLSMIFSENRFALFRIML